MSQNQACKSFQLKRPQSDGSIIYRWGQKNQGRWVPCLASCVNTSSRLDKEELWLQNNSKTVNLTKPLGTGPFEVLAILGTVEWSMNSIATNHHQAHMIPWLRPCVRRLLDYCSCWVASGAVIGPKLGAHVSKQDEDWTLWSSLFKDLKGSIRCHLLRDPNTKEF